MVEKKTVKKWNEKEKEKELPQFIFIAVNYIE